jgi:hypothetical protein
MMRFDYYSEEQLLQVHEASLDFLKKVGISTSSERFRTLLLDNGCIEKGKRILFTQDVIDKGMKTVPAVFNLYGRNDQHRLEIGSKKAYAKVVLDKAQRDRIYVALQYGTLIYELYCDNTQHPLIEDFKIPQENAVPIPSGAQQSSSVQANTSAKEATP